MHALWKTVWASRILHSVPIQKKPAENKKSPLNVFMDGDALMQPKERRPPCQTLSRGQMNHNFRKHQEFYRPIQVLSVRLQPARIAGKKVCCQICAFHRIFYHQSLKIHSTESVCKISVSYTGGFVQSFLHFALEELLFPMVFFPKKWTVHPKCFSRAHLFFLWIFIANHRKGKSAFPMEISFVQTCMFSLSPVMLRT